MAFAIARSGPELPDLVSIEEAARVLQNKGMKIAKATLQRGIQQKVFPFGDCVECERERRFYIYGRLLERWCAERFGEVGTT